MSGEPSSPDPAHRTERDSPSLAPQGEFRELRPGLCPECRAEVQGDARFCSSCRAFLPDHWVGRLASPRRRLVAALLDGVFKEGGLFGMALWTVVLPPGTATTVVRIMSVIYGITALAFWTRGTTPAKRLLHLIVITEDGKPAGFFRMAFRETIGKWISTIAAGLGLLAVATDKENRGWHDGMAATWVVHEEED